MSGNNQNNRRHLPNRNRRQFPRNGNSNGKSSNKNKENKEKKDKKVPLHYETKSTKVMENIELKLEINKSFEKVKLPVFEDGTDEQFLKLVREFRNMIETYALWEQETGVGVRIIYRSFRRCLSGAARDLWDQTNVIA